MTSSKNGARVVQVYRSSRRPDTYLYMASDTPLDRLPEALLESFGKPQEALRLWLTPDKALARVSGDVLLAALDDKGYYLQLPDPANSLDDQLASLAARVTGRGRTGGSA